MHVCGQFALLRLCVFVSRTQKLDAECTIRCAFVSAFQSLFVRPIIFNQSRIIAPRRNKKEEKSGQNDARQGGIMVDF